MNFLFMFLYVCLLLFLLHIIIIIICLFIIFLVEFYLDKEGALHEGQAGFRINRSCMDNVYTLNEIVQGRLREDKKTCILFRYSESL